MGCTSCGSKAQGVCKVCALLDGDLSIKEVQFCGFCNVYICSSCEGNIGKRFKAFTIAKAGELKQKWNNLLELWQTK